MSARQVSALALLLAGVACSAGRQPIGYERSASPAVDAGPMEAAALDFSTDTQLPWFGGPAYHARWPNGLLPSASYVPIGVWMQNPENADRYRAVGVNLFIGLWEGPTVEQLDALPAPQVRTFCGQSGVWKDRLDDAVISGWMHDDSPDNAQELPDGSYGPCIEPSVMQADYARMSGADASRPVFLLFGHGVADTEWVGRGSCTGRTDMYSQYARAGDVLGFYSYPISRGLQPRLIADGVENLLAWSDHDKPVIALIEAANIDGVARPTPEQIRAEAWLALTRGAAGIAYFCHRFMPDFSETDCLEDADTHAMLARINREISLLAPALNSPMIGNGVTVEAGVEIATRLARVSGVTYLFAASLSPEPTLAHFSLRGFDRGATGSVIEESREFTIEGDELADDFDGYGVHLYRIVPR